jgi:transcriptional regulator with XRE-family HTH domain
VGGASLGEQLRTQREKKGITLEQAAADTRIREKFLQALEAGDYPSLPGAVYTRGFLRNYAEYLDLDAEALLTLYQRERAQPEPPQAKTFKPYRPVVHRSLIFRPVVFVPVIVIGFVSLFAGYMYYQFSTFAVKPRLEITEPATDLISNEAKLVVRGVTVPDGRLTIRVYPGPETLGDVKTDDAGRFGVTIALRPGGNHVEVEVLDATGKTNRVTRSIQYAAQLPSATQAALVLEQPANNATITNNYVQISGRAPGLASVTINDSTMPVNADGRFETRYYAPAGQQTFTIVARASNGQNVTETRTVNVVYTQAVVTVFVKGGDAWILASVDGNLVTGAAGRTYRDGETAVFAGREVRIKSGNGAVTQVIYNGQPIASLGKQGEVVERVFLAQ